MKSEKPKEAKARFTKLDPSKLPITRFWNACRSLAIMPLGDWEQAITGIYAEKFKDSLPLEAAHMVFENFKAQILAEHYRLARSVQPLGSNLDPLAAAIGAVRSRDPRYAKLAAEHIGNVAIKAFENGDKATLARIQKLSAVKLPNHRNFQVWIAIEEYMRKTPGTPDAPMPTTADIRRHVVKHAGNESFSKLPGTKDNKGWTRLWEDSGAGLIIPKGVRGKNA